MGGEPRKLRWKVGEWGDYAHGLFNISHRMLRRHRPDLYGWKMGLRQLVHDIRGTYSSRDLIAEQMWLGSIHPAVVVSVSPDRIAAYSSDLDCVAILGYSAALLEGCGLRERSRLLTVNYYSDGPPDTDIVFGPGKCTSWTGMQPIIADFLTTDQDRLEKQKEEIPDALWTRTWTIGRERLRDYPEVWRPGRP
jgi:hypothetical protein